MRRRSCEVVVGDDFASCFRDELDTVASRAVVAALAAGAGVPLLKFVDALSSILLLVGFAQVVVVDCFQESGGLGCRFVSPDWIPGTLN